MRTRTKSHWKPIKGDEPGLGSPSITELTSGSVTLLKIKYSTLSQPENFKIAKFLGSYSTCTFEDAPCAKSFEEVPRKVVISAKFKDAQ